MSFNCDQEILLKSAVNKNNEENTISNGLVETEGIENIPESCIKNVREWKRKDYIGPMDPSNDCRSFEIHNDDNCNGERLNYNNTDNTKQLEGIRNYNECQLKDKELLESPREGCKDTLLNIHQTTSSACSTLSSGVNKLDKEEETIASDTILTERWSPLGANCDDSVSVDISELASGGDSESELMSYQSDQTSDKNIRNKYVKLMMNDLSLNSDLHLEEDRYDGTNDLHEERLRSLEEEHEFLTSSLMALTSHFAHVQLRVRQIVEAPAQQRDNLLKDLEEFAFREIPDVSAVITSAPKRNANHSCMDNEDNGDTVDSVLSATGSEDETATLMLHQRQSELIHYLKSQLIELEKLAYESGAPVLPQHILLEKQKIIIDELKRKLNFKVDDEKLPELSTEELKVQVDHALGEFVGPLKMKEQLVAQLKTQITDLERFIAFLQCDTDEHKLKTLTGGKSFNEAYNSYAIKQRKDSQNYGLRTSKNKTTAENRTIIDRKCNEIQDQSHTIEQQMTEKLAERKSVQTKAHGFMDKASLLLQMFATTHFGNRSQQFQKNTLKRTHKGNHWGDLRAQLEVDVQEVASLAATLAYDRMKLTQMQAALQRNENQTKNSLRRRLSDAGILYELSTDERTELNIQDTEKEEDQGKALESKKRLHCPNKRLLQRVHFQGDSIDILRKELTMAVRKNFSTTLARLIQHGLEVQSVNDSIANNLMVPFMRCLHPIGVSNLQKETNTKISPNTSYFEDNCGEYEDSMRTNYPMMHAWQLITEYYHLKRGDEYNNTPARKLSQSFNLDIVDSSYITVKQNLLASVGAIMATHRPYKRSPNALFKAFVCAGLNCHQLVDWLNLIFNCNKLVEMYYSPNSYVARTGFRDALRTINTLTKYDFDLPVDFAIQHFRHL